MKELTVASRVIPSKKLSTLVSNSIKCKQNEVNTYTLDSLACVGSSAGCGAMLSG